jgi:hypothetical protein
MTHSIQIAPGSTIATAGNVLLATGATPGATAQTQIFNNAITAAAIKPPTDSVTAIQLQNAAGTSVLNVDTTNQRVGIGTTSPSQKFVISRTRADLPTSGTTTSSFLQFLPDAGVNSLYMGLPANNPWAAYIQSADSNSLSSTRPLTLNPNGGNVGIGTTAPTYLLSLGGNAARTVWMERHTTADTAGNALTVQAGGATAAATDKAGGDLKLYPGVSTGSAESGVQIYGCVAGASGTADRTQTLAIQVLGNKLAFFAATPVAKQTGCAVPTDLATCITAITALRTALNNYALTTVV